MPVKPAVKAVKESAAKETARPARKTTARVSTAKHRNSIKQEAPAIPDSQEIIASIAYGYWESRGYQGGDPVEDWMRAEQEYLNSKTPALAAAASA